MVAMINFMDATIPNGVALSNEIDLRGGAVTRIWIPTTFDGSAVTFLGAEAQGPFFDLYDELGTELTIPVTPGRSYVVPVEWTLGCQRLQVRAGTTASPTTQTGETIIGLSVRPFA